MASSNIPQIVMKKLKIDKGLYEQAIGNENQIINQMRQEYSVDIAILRRFINLIEVVFRGERSQVEMCAQIIRAMLANVENKEISMVLTVERDLHGMVIGRGGATIQRLRRENNGVLIIIPPIGSKSPEINLRGLKEDVERAMKSIEKLVASVVDVAIPIPPAIMCNFVSNGRFNVEYFAQLPASLKLVGIRQNSILMKGPEDEVEKFRRYLTARIEDCARSLVLEMPFDFKMLQYIRMYCEGGFDQVEREMKVRIDYTNHPDKILFYGSNAQAAIGKIQRAVCDFGPMIEKQVDATLINERTKFAILFGISEFVRTLAIHFRVLIVVKYDFFVEKIVVYGREPDVVPAIIKIQEIIQEWKDATVIEVQFPDSLIKAIQSKATDVVLPIFVNHNVLIEIPITSDYPMLLITGRINRCKEVIDILKSTLEITKVIQIPSWHHGRLLGRFGCEVKRIKQESGTKIIRFPLNGQGDDVLLRGTLSSIEKAEQLMANSLHQTMTQFRNPKRHPKQHDLLLNIQKDQWPLIITRDNDILRNIMAKYQVEIFAPNEQTDPSDDDFVIRCPSISQCRQASAEIRRIIGEESERPLEHSSREFWTKETSLSLSVIPFLIGTQGWRIKSFESIHNVKVKFFKNRNQVLVSGALEKSVDDALKALLRLAELLSDKQ